MQRPYPVDLARQDLGTCLDRAPAPHPLGSSGPMAQGHLMTVEIPDAPKELQSGSIPFGKDPICQRATNQSEVITKQVLCRSGLFLNHEPNVKSSLPDIKTMVFPYEIDSPYVAAS